MKKFLVISGVILASLGWSCKESDSSVKSDFTGNESVYPLQAGSVYNIDGTVTFKERSDGTTQVTIALSGTEGNLRHPVHLHLGDISTDGASVAALLNPVNGSTGISETTLTILADESKVTYQQLVKLNACVKVHLSDSGPEQDIVLAGGNIGDAATKNMSNGRLEMGVCKSN